MLPKGELGASVSLQLTLILLTWKIWWAPNNASRLQMGFNLAFKGLTQSLQRLATAWTVHRYNPGGGVICLTGPNQPWSPPSLLYNWYRLSFAGVKRLGRGVDHPPASSAEVKERVELYLCSPSGPICLVLGWTLSFFCMKSGAKTVQMKW